VLGTKISCPRCPRKEGGGGGGEKGEKILRLCALFHQSVLRRNGKGGDKEAMK